MVSSSDGLPKFIERGGVQTYAPPILAKGVRMWSFALRGQHDAFQSIVDTYLNAPAPAQTDYTFRAVGDLVFLAYAPMDHISVTDPAQSNTGFMREADIAFWMLVAAGKTHLGAWVPEKLVWFLPYVWVDVSTAVATGREVYGFPKELAWLETPKNPSDPLVFALSTMVLPTYTPQTELVQRPLLEVERTSGDEPGIASAWTELEQAFQGVVSAIHGSSGKLSIPPLGLDISLLDHLMHLEMPMIFLKEFRDAADPHRACYQRIIGAPARVVGFRIAYPLLGSYDVAIHHYASHRIVENFGFDASDGEVTRIRPAFGFYVDYDFQLELGSEFMPRASGGQ